MKSPIYWNTFIYEVAKKTIWRRKKADIIKRREAIYHWIPPKTSVVDVAAGTSYLYSLLKSQVSWYLAIESNPSFVRHLRRMGIHVIQADIRIHPIPIADVIIMVAALYHFKDKENEILDKLLSAARLHVIIIEPTGRPLSISSWKDRIKAKSGDIGEGPIYYRIGENQLLSICERSGAIEHYATLPNNEVIVVLKGKVT